MHVNVHGGYRWVLFPPGTPRTVVKPDAWLQADGEGEAVDWFMKHWEVRVCMCVCMYDLYE